MAEMQCCSEWQPVLAMVAIDFALAILNVLLKKVIDQGLEHLILVTYRTAIATIFLASITYFRERKSRHSLTTGILCSLFISALVGLESLNVNSIAGRAKVLGTVICVGGAMLMALYRGVPSMKLPHSAAEAHAMKHTRVLLSSKKSHERWIAGSLVLIAGGLLWSSWFLIQAKIGKIYPYPYGIVGSGLCFVGMSWCVRKRGPLFTAAFSPHSFRL